ncbi:MAG TPA: metallopeptidase TldD-related protein [Longimicrobiales bacterium]
MRERLLAWAGLASRPVGDSRILSAEDCEGLLARAHAMAEGGGDTEIEVRCWWQGELRWARSRVSLSSDRRDVAVSVRRTLPNGTEGAVLTNQLDDASIEGAVRAAERASALGSEAGRGIGYYPPFPEYARPAAAVWSDATYGLTAEARGDVARALAAPAEAKGMLSAGYIEVRAGAHARIGTGFDAQRPQGRHAVWHQPYTRWTQARCSLTVRDASGAGSGWAGLSSYDWARVDPQALAARALEKCIASRNPVAIEPGRYTVILEPQAVADLVGILAKTFHETWAAPGRVWYLTFDNALSLNRSKLGLKVVDERVTIRHDFADPDLGIVARYLESPKPVAWIENGVLTALGHDMSYEVRMLEGRHALRSGIGFRMDGGETSVEEMIRTTQRGLLVTRFSNLDLLDEESLLSTGLTRDGLWLIENGKITKAVKNFRFTESPLFALNNIDQLGEPVRTLHASTSEWGELQPAIVPPLKIRDFSFTSTIDAI